MPSIVPNVSILAQSVNIMPEKTGDMHSYPFKSLPTTPQDFPSLHTLNQKQYNRKGNGNRKGWK